MFFPAHVQKKFLDLEDKQDIKILVDNLKNESEDINRQLKQYGCSTENELIKKMALELSYYELFIKKFNEFAFLINLKMTPDLNDTSYQDTFSKFFLMKTVIEKLLEKTDNNTSNISVSSSSNIENSKLEASVLAENKVLEMTHIDQFFNYETNNKVILHIKQLLSTSYDKIAQDLETMGSDYKDQNDKIPSKLFDN